MQNVAPRLKGMTCGIRYSNMFLCGLLTTMDKNNLVESMDLNENHDLNFCDGCLYGKHHHTSFPLSGDKRAKEIIGLVHTNLCGPIARTFHGGAKYF